MFHSRPRTSGASCFIRTEGFFCFYCHILRSDCAGHFLPIVFHSRFLRCTAFQKALFTGVLPKRRRVSFARTAVRCRVSLAGEHMKLEPAETYAFSTACGRVVFDSLGSRVSLAPRRV